jgi:hypothetical protein
MHRFAWLLVALSSMVSICPAADRGDDLASLERQFRTLRKDPENTGSNEALAISCKVAQETTAEAQHGHGDARDGSDTEELLQPAGLQDRCPTRENTGFPEVVQIPCKIARQTTAEAQHGPGEATDDSDTEELVRLLRANPELAQLLRGLATRAPSAEPPG